MHGSPCAECGNPNLPSPQSKYCGDCKWITATCVRCGKPFIKHRRSGTKNCSTVCGRVLQPLRCRVCDVRFIPSNGMKKKCDECAGKPLQYDHECQWCGRDYRSPKKRSTSCSLSCSAKYRNFLHLPPANPSLKNHHQRSLFYGVQYERVNHAIVFERDEWTCRLCWKPVDKELAWPDPLSASLDHIVPMSLGGDHLYTNVQLAHFLCNMRKGASLEAEYNGREGISA